MKIVSASESKKLGLVLLNIYKSLKRMSCRSGNQHLTAVGVVETDVGDASAQLLVKCHLEFIMLPLFLSPSPPPSPLSPSSSLSLFLSLLLRLMAVEDELRGGPMIEPKTRIFADQVCDTASSLVESVRRPVLSSPPSPTALPLFFLPPATVMVLSAVCMWSL